jgi:DNA-binding beta-propeller fold protein YncE
MARRARAALLAGLVLAAVGCSAAGPACTTATQPAPSLPARATAMTTATLPGTPAGLQGSPFGVAVTAGGQWAFASLGSAVAVLRLSAGRPAAVVRSIELPALTAGVALTRDGRYLLLAGGAGAVVVSVSAAEQGSPHAVLGELSAPGGSDAGAIEVAVSRDGRYAFVSLEDANQVAVFNLAAAVADGFGGSDGSPA